MLRALVIAALTAVLTACAGSPQAQPDPFAWINTAELQSSERIIAYASPARGTLWVGSEHELLAAERLTASTLSETEWRVRLPGHEGPVRLRVQRVGSFINWRGPEDDDNGGGGAPQKQSRPNDGDVKLIAGTECGRQIGPQANCIAIGGAAPGMNPPAAAKSLHLEILRHRACIKSEDETRVATCVYRCTQRLVFHPQAGCAGDPVERWDYYRWVCQDELAPRFENPASPRMLENMECGANIAAVPAACVNRGNASEETTMLAHKVCRPAQGKTCTESWGKVGEVVLYTERDCAGDVAGHREIFRFVCN